MDREHPILSSGLKRLIAGLSVLRSPEPEQLLSLMASAGVCAEELEPWADYGHSPCDSYGRHLVWHGGHVEVMVMTWLPGDFSAIHDHGLAQWGAVQCFGQAEHYSYRLRRLHLCDEQALPYGPGQVRAVSPASPGCREGGKCVGCLRLRKVKRWRFVRRARGGCREREGMTGIICSSSAPKLGRDVSG